MSDWVSPESHKQVCDALARTIIERDRLRGGEMSNDEFWDDLAKKYAAEINRLRDALAVFADPESWTELCNDVNEQQWAWNKLGDYSEPREFARRALEGE